MPDRPSFRARCFDASLLALAAFLSCLFFLDSTRTVAERGPWYPAADVVAGSVACLALLLRRRWPVAVAVALIPSFVVSPAMMGATPVALGAVAVYRSWRTTAALLGLHAVAVTGVFGLATTNRREFWQGLAVVLALDVALVASGLLVRSQRLLVLSLRERARVAEEGHRLRIEEVRHAERERIAREMHDVLAHRISLLAVHAGALEVRRSAPQDERQAAGVIRQCAYEALEDLRQVIGMLRAAPDPGAGVDADRPQPTWTDLPALIEQSRLAGARVTLDNRLTDLARVPDGIGRHVYRIIQEGLTNARKHAPGEPVLVRLTGPGQGETTDGPHADRQEMVTNRGASLVVEMTNPMPIGGVAPLLPGAGSGLIGLGERVHLLGGRFEHGRTPDGGFRLYAQIPLRL